VRRHQPGGGESQAIEPGAAGDHGDLVVEQHLVCLLSQGGVLMARYSALQAMTTRDRSSA
jgi:hypothetical protein